MGSLSDPSPTVSGGSGSSTAADVAVTPVGNITATDVQAALEGLDLAKATPAEITAAINDLVNAAPGTLDTLGEIAAQLGSDESAAAALATTVAGKIPSSLVDAKGDLLAGTADNAVGRLAVGSNGQVLTADSAQTSGVKWAASAGLPTGGTQGQALVKQSDTDGDATWKTPPWGGGDYFGSGLYAVTDGVMGSMGTENPGLGQLRLAPFFVPVRRAFDRIGMDLSIAASAGGVLRMGIYAQGAGWPGALLLDAGTVDSTSTGPREIVIAQTLDPGFYWLAVVAQVAAPYWRYHGSPGASRAFAPTTGPPTEGPWGAIGVTGVTGALPSTISRVGAGNNIRPAIALRAA